ncbi:peptidase M23 [Lysobacter sp. TY2-98]|uniref:murein hydrolase activator EnvC family protein n=1 Tax=Lysobacter sp. TY2-98 TaxID=2290922 RepID=UPI000E205A74|nr:peptidoglycan DD-metalloendopeptidase family protein [Lysobacter sp. TY2-98]AXK73005.1 peptidase M23 [Lysobacter sp. TY2-98]
MRLRAVVLALLLLAPAWSGAAQDTRGTEKKLQAIKRELQGVAAERRQLETQRGSASQQLRQADEQVGRSGRVLQDTQSKITDETARLAQLRAQQAQLRATLGGARDELATLLRAADRQGPAGPLKSLLARDRVEDAQRLLTYHAYLEKARAKRIRELTAQLAELDHVEAEIAQRTGQLTAAQQAQVEQLKKLQQDRENRAALVAQLDAKYKDRAAREQALGRDAKSLESLLQKLRIAAAKAREQQRRLAEQRAREAAAAAKADAEAARIAKAEGRPAPPKHVVRPPVQVATAPSPQVGGLGWPLSGALLAGYGGTMPDGRRSDGLLIAANTGTAVRAVADGTVVYADWMTGYGQLLIIDHGNGYMSLYAHNDALLKDTGTTVHRGDGIATVGTSGGQGRPSLYFELRRNGQPVDPGVWLRR